MTDSVGLVHTNEILVI